MNIERSFSFAFKSQGALKKLLLGGLFTFLFFTVYFAFVVMGYLMRVLCDGLEGRDAKLPEWKELGTLFNDGLFPGLIFLGYFSPLFFLIIVELMLNSFLGPSVTITLFMFLARFVLFIGITIVLPVGLIRFAVKRSAKAAFEFGHIIDFIKNNPGAYFKAWLLSALVGLISIFGLLGFVVGLAFTGFVANLVSVHLFTDAYRDAKPFPDDKDGALRSSMAIPPPLSHREVTGDNENQ